MSRDENLPWGNGPAQKTINFMWLWNKCCYGEGNESANTPDWYADWKNFCTPSWRTLNDKIRNRGWV